MKPICATLLLSVGTSLAAENPARHPLDPRGQMHIPIGFPNTVDQLKTFVEAEGNFSPGMCLNEGAPDVAVVNYNVFNRDGMYVANIFQKSGNFDLAEQAIDYFLKHPFNGRVQPEADNPGQILWIMGDRRLPHFSLPRSRNTP
ncbi:MAG: hypothetical protein HZA90_26195 [Verrucomicrobia bacterium]|nr:hypothetical protein [Verrucomicrobiota bacterium]